MSPLCIPANLDPFQTCSICIMLDCTLSKGMYHSELDQGGVNHELIKPGIVLWDGV